MGLRKKQYSVVTPIIVKRLLPLWLVYVIAILMSSCQLTEVDKEFIYSKFTVEGCEELGSCEPKEQPHPGIIEPGCFVERYIQPTAEISKEIDILFVTDTSGSLDEERASIADGIDAFVNALPSDADYQIGVMLAHANTAYSGKLWRKGTHPYVLKSSEMDLNEIRSHLSYNLTHVSEESATDGGEAGLVSLYKSTQGANLLWNKEQGFFRENAALAVVFIADENDVCAVYPDGVTPVRDPDGKEAPAFRNFCFIGEGGSLLTPQAVYQQLKALKKDLPLLVGGIIYSDPNAVPRGGENEVGYGYLETIQASGGGITVDLANGRYEEGLEEIGTLASLKLNLLTDFTLARPNVDQSTIEVKVDSLLIGHSYQRASNEVHILEPGGPTSVVDIYYCLEPDESGGGIIGI